MEEYIEDVLDSKDLAQELLDALDSHGEHTDDDLSDLLMNNCELFDAGDLFQ